MKLSNQTILLTGGTGSFGNEFIRQLLAQKSFKGVIRVYSRDEFKQYTLERRFDFDDRLRFFIGDIRDSKRLHRATEGVDIVIHAAALKHVPLLEYNPFEAVKTNIVGSQNVIDTAIDSHVKKVILISSDKAVSPINLYGATKLVAEKIFVRANSYVGSRKTIFSVVRYGNVMGSRGSVLDVFLEQSRNSKLTLTDERMTRFWLTLSSGVNFVMNCIGTMAGGEIFIPKIPSLKIIDLAKAINPSAKITIIGIRPGEKIHETLVSMDEGKFTREFKDKFVIVFDNSIWKSKNKISRGKSLNDNFYYSSLNNKQWLNVSAIRKLVNNFNKNGF